MDVRRENEVQDEHEEDSFLETTLEARIQRVIQTTNVKVPPLGTAENEAYWKEVVASASIISSKGVGRDKPMGGGISLGNSPWERKNPKDMEERKKGLLRKLLLILG